MSDRWLYARGLASMGLGGASLIVPLYVVELGGWIAATGYRIAFAVAGGSVLVGTAVVLVLRWRVARPTAGSDRMADAATGGE